jgi:hypothetical protein
MNTAMSWPNDVVCPSCGTALEDRVKGPYHLGFGDIQVAYCRDCGVSLSFSLYDPNVLRIGGEDAAGSKGPRRRAEGWARIMEALVRCACGGAFDFNADPRCPRCHASLRATVPEGYCILFENGLNAERGDAVWVG